MSRLEMRRTTAVQRRAVLALAMGGAIACGAADARAQTPVAPATPNAGGSAAAAQFPECTRTPTEADVEGAKGAHKAATQFFERGDYERALSYWRDAYGFDCTRPPLLLNIASAYEKKGDKAAAVAVLELFLMRAKDSPDAPVVREKIANLQAAIEAEAAPTPPLVPSTDPQPTPTTPPDAEMARPFGITPWIVVAAGGAVALGGVVPLAIGSGMVSDAEAGCTGDRTGCTAEAADDGNTGRTLSLVGQIMIPVGLVTAAGGLVWQLAFNQEQPVGGGATQGASPGPRATVVPAVGPGFQGAVVTGAF